MMLRYLIQLLVWARRKLGLRAIVSLALLLTVMNIVAAGIVVVVRGVDEEWGWLWTLSAVALSLGWWLGRTALRGWWVSLLAGLLAVFSGMSIVTLHVGRLTPSLVALLGAALFLAWRAFRRAALDSEESLDLATTALTFAWAELSTGVNMLLVQAGEWVSAIVGGSPSYDAIATVLLWSLVF